MKTKSMIILLFIQFVVIVLMVKWIVPDGTDDHNKIELLREISPKGDYVLLIEKLNMPISYSFDSIEVTLFENNSRLAHYSATFDVDVHTGKGTADYRVEWLEDGVQIILSGIETRYYVLPFKTLEDSWSH